MCARNPPDDQRVLDVEAALEGFAQCGKLFAQLAARKVGEDDRIGGPGHERVEHRPPGLAIMSVATQSSLMPVSCIALCSRFISR